MHDPTAVTRRKPLSTKQRLALFVHHGGRCCLCGQRIEPGRAWLDEHIAPLWRDGTNESDNRAPAHVACAKAKTSKEAGERAKGRSVAAKHFGAKVAKGPPMAGCKRSRWKKKINGEVIPR